MPEAGGAGSGAVAILNEHQRHHIKASCQYIDRLIGDLEAAVAGAESGSSFARYVADLTPVQSQALREFAAALRHEMLRVMTRLGIEPGTTPTSARHATRSSLGFIEIALEEIKPQYMRGYGALHPDAVPQLNGLVVELQALVHRVEAALGAEVSGDPAHRIAALDATRGTAAALAAIERAIRQHDLAEHRPALVALLDRHERLATDKNTDQNGGALRRDASLRRDTEALRQRVGQSLAAIRARASTEGHSPADAAAVEAGLRRAAGLFEDVRKRCEALRNPPQRELTEALDLAAERAATALDFPSSMPGGVGPAIRAAIAQVSSDFADDVRRPLGVLVEQIEAAVVEACRAVGAPDPDAPRAWAAAMRRVPVVEMDEAPVEVRIPFRKALGPRVAFSRVRGAIATQIGARVEAALRAHGLALHEWSLGVLARVRQDFATEAERIRARLADPSGSDAARVVDQSLAAIEAARIEGPDPDPSSSP